jgi:hypothetical protein
LSAADCVRVYPAAYTAITAAELTATRPFAIFLLLLFCAILNNCTQELLSPLTLAILSSGVLACRAIPENRTARSDAPQFKEKSNE